MEHQHNPKGGNVIEINNERVALWVGWQTEDTDRSPKKILGDLAKELPEDYLASFRLEYLSATRTTDNRYRGRAKLSVPKALLNPDDPTAEPPAILCNEIEHRWRRRLRSSSPGAQVQIVVGEAKLGRWRTYSRDPIGSRRRLLLC